MLTSTVLDESPVPQYPMISNEVNALISNAGLFLVMITDKVMNTLPCQLS